MGLQKSKDLERKSSAVSLSDMEADPAYLPNGIPRCPITGSKYTLDAAKHRVSGHDH